MSFTCQKLGKYYRTRNGTTLALDEISFTVRDREIVCIVGPSGCGKTTLLKLIAGLLKPTAGEVVFSPDRPKGHPQTALVFQDHGLFPWMNVVDNIAFGLEMSGMGRAERRNRAGSFLHRIGLGSFGASFPHELSVGMQQRVGIARAFVSEAEILLMDEPFGSLDAQTKQVLREELLRIWSTNQKTIVFVTHDIEEAILLSDRILVMTGRPARIQAEIPVSLPRPRDLQDSNSAFLAEMKWRIWKMLETQVRQSLSIPA